MNIESIRMAALFPGQGSQYPGMEKLCCEMSPTARLRFEEASDLLGYDLRKFCGESDGSTLMQTEITQPAIFVTSVAMFEWFLELHGIQPYLYAGHSLGEWTALTCAGALTFHDAVQLVQKRGLYMQQAAENKQTGMRVVNHASREQVMKAIESLDVLPETLVVACYNAPDQTVISGHSESLQKVTQRLEQQGAAVIPLKVSAAFHSPYMEPAAQLMKEAISQVQFHQPKGIVLSNLDGLPYRSSDEIGEKLTAQLTNSVRWVETMEALHYRDLNYAVEFGPRSVLKKLVPIHHNLRALSIDVPDDFTIICSELAAIDRPKQAMRALGFENELQIVKYCLAASVSTPNRNDGIDELTYEKNVVHPYRLLEQIHYRLEAGSAKVTEQELRDCSNLLDTILANKQIHEGLRTSLLYPVYEAVRLSAESRKWNTDSGMPTVGGVA
ncbi:ACP S-malonyltransferase [Paenibacillus rhizophilus]|uniref:[acyl-carrier-protein] S-malonyltransferase n=1 Tax=Paenibacillus rhizophilus TaxID=1850366 RepID=A0A3N9P2V5_9BACL|nr:ACP S-malonyltransferase [Paenibacillus rhizophilus]RQW09680.1 [acyl-carrier-protein] S-malonyltransferase [Paenibacillus rhizophilus]